jgi:hypothetical protein
LLSLLLLLLPLLPLWSLLSPPSPLPSPSPCLIPPPGTTVVAVTSEDGGLQRGQELVPLASLDVGSESRVDVRHSLPTH